MVEIDEETSKALEVMALYDMNTHDNIVKAMRLKEEATLTNNWLEETIQRIIYIQLNTREWSIDTSKCTAMSEDIQCYARITKKNKFIADAYERNPQSALICAYANALRTVNTNKWKQEEQTNKMKNELIRYRAMLMIIGEYDSDWKPSTSKEHEVMVKAKIQLMEEGIIQ
ncbi:MAG: hypothetical protein PHU49_17085 [Syntrophorhabdaceae bacterium]|jgi:hypothetical protein|nr:hypothetical protein [Syntrophorhabdaceae bacterium]